MRHLYYDRSGKPIASLDEWNRLREDPDTSRVALTEGLPDCASVSTVWFGVDSSLLSDPPLIFESMVFGGYHHHERWQYASEAAALAGHDQIVAALREGHAP